MNVLVRAFHAPGEKSQIHAVRGMLATVRLTVEKFEPSVVVFACEGGHGYRRQLLPSYKSSRTKPPGLAEQIALALQALDAIGWPALRSAGFEADDVAATIAHERSAAGDEVFVATTDKDLRQLMTLDGVSVVDPYKRQAFTDDDIRERFSVEPSQIGDLLALAGDKSDEIPGVPGIGNKTAATLLTEFGDLDGVLDAAKYRATMKTPKHWSRLHEHRDDALISRRLVELQTSIPLPTGWIDWPATNPRRLWIDDLRKLGLGQSATKLGEVFGEPRRTETPLAIGESWNESAADCERPYKPAAPKPVSTGFLDQCIEHGFALVPNVPRERRVITNSDGSEYDTGNYVVERDGQQWTASTRTEHLIDRKFQRHTLAELSNA